MSSESNTHHIRSQQPRQQMTAPALPLPILDIILALAPRLGQSLLRFAPQLLCVLPQTAASKVLVSVMLAIDRWGLRAPAASSLDVDRFVARDPSVSGATLPVCLTTDLSILLAGTNRDHPRYQPLWRKLVCAAARLPAWDLLDYLETRFELVTRHPDIAEIVSAACANKSCSVLEWLQAHGFPLDSRSQAAILKAAELGSVSVLDFLARHGLIWPQEDVDPITKQACLFGHKTVLEFTLDTYEDYFEWDSSYWDLASEHGHVDLLIWAKSRLRAPFHVGIYLHAMDLASANNHVAVLDWWHINCEKLCFSVNAMDDTSANGHLRVLEWWARSGLEMRFTVPKDIAT
ncbi:hypothetical protein BCR44DRAFT_1510983 [Catenaria anguillulae PL171]|uniref:Ankyrin repeat-containing domain protein n=1 Tax=Catenaria anguillulae PL171 TaxID=765915 RepID=A0A1Y2HVJ8_9FUNG|nr:hypothetical protein BCR44DRAFT_1510983 [Catenaria anguillulae PL171]